MYVKVEFTLSVSTCIFALVRLGQVDLDLVEIQRDYLELVKPCQTKISFALCKIVNAALE